MLYKIFAFFKDVASDTNDRDTAIQTAVMNRLSLMSREERAALRAAAYHLASVIDTVNGK